MTAHALAAEDHALRDAAEAALRRALPVDCWFLFVEARAGRLRVTGLDRTGGVPERVQGALAALPGMRGLEVRLSRAAAWPVGA